MPRPLVDFLSTPSVKATLIALVLWGAMDVAYSHGMRGFGGGSVSRAVAMLYRAYPVLAEATFLVGWATLGLILTWHFRGFSGR